MEAVHTIEELKMKQALPLDVKVRMTKIRIREWINEFGEDGVYVSFSGGKDSTVLLHLVREDYPNVPAVFVDTGLEYPEIREFVKKFDNVTWLKPKMNFKQVINKYGYPFFSKEVSEVVAGAKTYLTRLLNENTIPTDRQTDRQTDSLLLRLRTDNGNGKIPTPPPSNYCKRTTRRNTSTSTKQTDCLELATADEYV